VIPISTADVLRETSNLISIGVKIVLVFYFFRRYSQSRAATPLMWGTGFLFFALSQIPIMIMRYFQDPNTNMQFALLASSLAALAFTFLYYGTALLFFKKGSFMRKKLSIIFFVAMMAVILMFPITMSTETVLKSMFMVVVTGFFFPITLLMAIIFFMIWSRLSADNPRKPNVLLVGAAWLLYSMQSLLTSTYFGKHYDWGFYILASCLFLMLLYGMTFGKATGH